MVKVKHTWGRSGLEEVNKAHLDSLGVNHNYETLKIKYEVHDVRSYTPDFPLDNGVIIETKGRFTTEDRKKHLLVKKQHPELDIRFVFSNPNSRLYKGAKTTYGDWCKKHGFLYASKVIPVEWTKEKTSG